VGTVVEGEGDAGVALVAKDYREAPADGGDDRREGRTGVRDRDREAQRACDGDAPTGDAGAGRRPARTASLRAAAD
jgi:hypothetical protein